LLLLLLASASAWAQRTARAPVEIIQYPDLIIYNTKVVSMDDAGVNTSVGRTYQAMAILGDRIQFLGSNAQLLAFAGPRTRKLDLKGRLVLPGLIDTHNHLHDIFIGEWARKNPQEIFSYRKFLTVNGRTFDELTAALSVLLKDTVPQMKPGQWITVDLPGPKKHGIGKDYISGKHLARALLDKMAPATPVYIEAEGAFIMNTAGRDAFLKMFHVRPTDENETSALTTPQFSRALLTELYFRPRIPLMADILEDGLHHFSALGFTTFSSHSTGFTIHDGYVKLSREGRLPVRYAFTHRFCQMTSADIEGCFFRLGDIAGMGTGDPAGRGNDTMWNIGVTLGGLDTDPPNFCSTIEAPPEIKKLELCRTVPGTHYYDAVYTALRSRLRYVVNHVKGDKSLDIFLDLVDKVMADDPGITLDYIRSLRITSDHCGFYPRADQIPRMQRIGMAFSCGASQIEDMGAYLRIYGEKYADRITPIHSMLSGGLMVANEGGGSGMEPAVPTAFARYYPFITRKRSDGMIVAAKEAVDRVALMKMSTVWAAPYVLREKQIGTLETGKLADFVVFDKDYFTIPENEIPTVIPLMTVMGGKTQVLREELAKELGMQPVGPQLHFRFDLPAKSVDLQQLLELKEEF
jgi:predicted amidohydrolase YtcJ